MVNQYKTTVQTVHLAARTHTQKSKGTVGLSPARRNPPSYLRRPDLRITALIVHTPRPMAPGQDHHRHGERRGTMYTAKDSDTRPRSLGFRLIYMAGVG